MNQVERIGRFEVQERLRANSFVIVYRGRDPFDGRRVHIKFCVATDETIRRRFFKAAELASTLRHPNVATVFEFGSGDGKPYLVQEAFSEETLSDLLARAEPVDDVLKLYYLVQVARGLQHAHNEGVLHRELRPASILLDRAGETKIADFGTARLASAFTQLGNGAHRWPAVGWLLPELLLGLDLDKRSDIYAFGAVAFELLTGQAPFIAESLAGLVPQILETDPRPLGVFWPECPPELDRLVLRCLARDPGQRFSSMNDLVEEFDQVVPVLEPADVFEEEKTVVIEDVQTIDSHLPGWLLHGLSAACQFVKRGPLMFQGRIYRGNLGDRPGKPPCGLQNQRVRNPDHRVPGGDGSRFILRIRRYAQPKHRLVGFVSFEKELGKPRSPVDTADENPCGERIQRSRMTHFGLAGQFSYPGYDIVRSYPFWFINIQQIKDYV